MLHGICSSIGFSGIHGLDGKPGLAGLPGENGYPGSPGPVGFSFKGEQGVAGWYCAFMIIYGKSYRLFKYYSCILVKKNLSFRPLDHYYISYITHI